MCGFIFEANLFIEKVSILFHSLSMNLLISLFFCAINVLFQNQKCYAGIYFGCDYNNDLTFNIDRGDTDDLYGNILPAARIISDQDFNGVMTGIRIIINSFLINSTFNSMTSYQRLCSTVKSAKYSKRIRDSAEETYYTFLKGYKHRSITDSGGYIPILNNVLRKIIENYNRFRLSIYFAVGYGKAPKQLAMKLPLDAKLPAAFKYNFISGVVKFMKDQRVGYLMIIVDPEDGDITHFVVYENSVGGHISENGKMLFEYIAGDLKYMIRAEKRNVPAGTKNHNFVFIVEKPYCSIIKASKAETFLPRRSLVKRDKNGNVEASVEFEFPSMFIKVFWANHREYDQLIMDRGLHFELWRMKIILAPVFNVTVDELTDSIALRLIDNALFVKYYLYFAREFNGLTVTTPAIASSSSVNIYT